jgi:Cytochrome c
VASALAGLARHSRILNVDDQIAALALAAAPFRWVGEARQSSRSSPHDTERIDAGLFTALPVREIWADTTLSQRRIQQSDHLASSLAGVTEIPEHLLKRSRERREAAGLPTEGGATPTASTPAVATPAASPAQAATPAVPATPPPAPKPKPEPAYIRAAKTRKKMPFWAMSALSMLPIWGFLYLRGVQPQPEEASGPLAIGAEVYKKQCAGCHQANGQGGAGRPFWKGEVLKTFPKIEDQLNFVYNGSNLYEAAGITAIGDPNREGGPHVPLGYKPGAVMPAQGANAKGALTDEEILSVVCHERYKLGGAKETDEQWEAEYEKWCSPEAEMFLLLEDGETFEDEAFAAVGTEPRASKP